MSTSLDRAQRGARDVISTLLRWWRGVSGLGTDALLYAASGLFALVFAVTTNQGAQWEWGYIAAGPYVVGAILAAILAAGPARRRFSARVALLVLVGLGSVVVPLALETHWRQIHHDVGYAQPEVGVIERSGQMLANKEDPYRSYYVNGHVVNVIPNLPTYESFFPYFPLMGVFGLPYADTHLGKGLTDARVVMSLITLLTSLWALREFLTTRALRLRVAQVLLVLPTGALFLATGGDDMPILALSLLGLAMVQRRRPQLAGVTFGVAAAMKLTAWPIALGALLVEATREGQRRALSMAAWMAGIVAVTVTPFAVRGPRAFLSNVLAFPLGLAHVSSPAASPLPGHVLTTLWPPAGHVLTPLAFLVGGYAAWRYYQRHRPLSLAQVLRLLAVAFGVLICVSSATRIGYVIYPLNLWLWSHVVEETTVTPPIAHATR